MASTKFAHPTPFLVTASPRLEPPPLSCKHLYQHHTNAHTSIPAMSSLYGVIERANKASLLDEYARLWKLFIEGIDEIVGYVREEDCIKLQWDVKWFHCETVNKKGDEVRRITIVRSNNYLAADGISHIPSPAEACKIAFQKLLAANADKFPAFSLWKVTEEADQEYCPIHLADPGVNVLPLSIPLPLRGVLGILTVGVHLNVYRVKEEDGKETIDQIWVSHRSKDPNYSYPGMLDQIVAGGADTNDTIDGQLAPCKTLAREAREEAGLTIDHQTRQVFFEEMGGDDGDKKKKMRIHVGTVERASSITFFDLKDESAGDLYNKHLEPGLRIVYDLKITNPSFRPKKMESAIERFEPMEVPQVTESLNSNQWKPNCGLVMLDFMVRHGLVTKHDESRFERIKKDLHRPLCFAFLTELPRITKGW
ncbi:NUDIX hydrolase domain-containing protein [Fusarium napiforme]|uniref:NUDIX hydrolase domain-containing protein n=1 Tax=Fusarium napiforme TaxID=42672 RepID=A0A8H5K1C1_9HYPO|nr:NUDIX hydrolase domain-containing protein [Fusarium napiforme]